MVTDSARKRAKHTRSRRGCMVCRIRRIRCDETRPACKKCTSTGRKCEGLPKEAVEYALSDQIRFIQPTTSNSLAEDRSLAYFRTRTSTQFAAPFGNEFWSCIVLQIGERERCVRQAVIALGALHESFTDEHLIFSSPHHTPHKSSSALTNLATSSYTNALHELNQLILPDAWDSLHVSLLCCILFTSFEWLRGSYAAATTHLKSGLNIIRQWTSSCTSLNTPTAHFIRGQLAPMFVRLSLQARTFSDHVGPMPWLSASVLAPIPKSFQSQQDHLRSARTALDVLCGEVYLQPSRPALLPPGLVLSPQSSLDFSARLANWHAEYHCHLLPPSLSDSDATRPENVNLSLWYTALSLLQATSLTGDPMELDAYRAEFARMVHLSRLLLRGAGEDGGRACWSYDTLDTPQFRIDMETVPMLYHVASKCRDPGLRREAIGLLRSGASREGLWDAWAAARLAEEIVGIEEEGWEGWEGVLASEVPARQRVWRLEEETDLESRTIRVKFLKWGEMEYGEWRMLAW